MSVLAKIRANPVVQRLQAKDDFLATVAVSLRDWAQWEQAVAWCERHWEKSDRQYRRFLFVGSRTARFEFPGENEAIEFLLKYGARAEYYQGRLRTDGCASSND